MQNKITQHWCLALTFLVEDPVSELEKKENKLQRVAYRLVGQREDGFEPGIGCRGHSVDKKGERMREKLKKKL